MHHDRLHAELERLYGADGAATASGETSRCLLITAPAAQWRELARLWQAVQDDLGWPAAAIAVNGEAHMTLWFSLAEPHPAAELHRVAQALLQPLGPVLTPSNPAQAWQVWPPAPDQPRAPRPKLPPHAVTPEHWSAFLAPDLAPVFADTPWLDIPPSRDGQADLLTPLRSLKAEHLAVLKATQATPATATATALPRAKPSSAPDAAPYTTDASPGLGPRAFLRRVMQDEQAPLRWRIEAAKALLPHHHD